MFIAVALAQDVSPTALTDSGTSVKRVVVAVPFQLAETTRHLWVAERTAYDAGWLVVIEVEPEMARPRQVEVPVLYAGAVPVEILNVGYPSGVIVGIVPELADPRADPIFFGPVTLPERVDAAYGGQVAAAATAQGIRPRGDWSVAVAKGGGTVVLQDLGALHRRAADLIDSYATEEHERAENLRLTP